MNIFILDKDPIIAASYYIDRHMKIIIEIAQMLCTTSWYFGIPAPYKKTHFNHPVSIWVRKSLSNYNWAVIHGLAIAKQYTSRYHKIHKSQAIIEWCHNHGGKPNDIGLTLFAQAMPEKYMNEDAVKAYRDFYIGEKKAFASWKSPATIPYWWI